MNKQEQEEFIRLLSIALNNMNRVRISNVRGNSFYENRK